MWRVVYTVLVIGVLRRRFYVWYGVLRIVGCVVVLCVLPLRCTPTQHGNVPYLQYTVTQRQHSHDDVCDILLVCVIYDGVSISSRCFVICMMLQCWYRLRCVANAVDNDNANTLHTTIQHTYDCGITHGNITTMRFMYQLWAVLLCIVDDVVVRCHVCSCTIAACTQHETQQRSITQHDRISTSPIRLLWLPCRECLLLVYWWCYYHYNVTTHWSHTT